MSLSSCEFSPGEIQETFVEKPSVEVPPISFEITPDTDTLKLAEPVTIKYKFEASPRSIHWVEFAFDGVTLFQREYGLDASMEMTLNPYQYSEGLHTLKISVLTSTNSGTIADKLKVEGYSYELEWPVIIDFTPVRPIKILSIESMPGGALIKWERFTHASFKNYKLEKTAFFENKTEYIAEVTDPYSNAYFDTDYLEGENVYYRVTLNGDGSSGEYFSAPPGPIQAKWTSGYNVLVNWEPTQNPDRLDYYRIFQQDWVSPKDEKHILFEDKKELVFENVSLGSSIQINLQNVPKTTEPNFSFAGLEVSTATVAIGDPIPAHEVTKKIFGTNYTLMNNGNKLILYDHQNKIRLDSMDFATVKLRAYRISPDGKTIYTLTGNNLEAWQTIGFSKLGSVNLLDISSKLENLSDISVSNDFKILFVVIAEQALVYDFITCEILISPEENFGWAKISPDGNRVAVRYTKENSYYRCYELKDKKLNLLGETMYPGEIWGNYFFFSGPDQDQLILCHDTEIQVRKASDFSLLNSFTGSSWAYVDYDPETNLLVWAKAGRACNILKLPSGEIMKTTYLSPGNVILHRDFLIGKNGRQLNLSNL